MKILAALFGVVFLGGALCLWSGARASADGGRAPLAVGAGLITIAAFGWLLQLLVEGIDRLLRKRRRKPKPRT